MGMMDWVEDDEDDDSAESTDEEAPDDMDDMDDFDDDFDDFEDDFDDFDDSPDGSDGSGDEFDDFDDDGFDDFDDDGFDGGSGGGGGGGSGATNEQLADFEDRIGELETQVGSISSTMNTVREENKQIGETVDELDDTIRKLLDIYEMVTRGINPFVDDAKEMGGLEHGDGAFGLFDSEEEEEDNLSSDVVNADAEDFFDEDFGDLNPDQEKERAEAAAGETLSEEETSGPEMLEPQAKTEPTSAGTGSDNGGGSVSFDDLKAEYEDDGWEDDAASSDEPTDAEDAAEPDNAVEPDDAGTDDGDAEDSTDDESAVDDGDDGDDPTEVALEEEETGDDASDDDESESDPDVEADAEPDTVDDEESAVSDVDVDDADDADDADTTELETPDSPEIEPPSRDSAVGAAEAKTDDRMFEPDPDESQSVPAEPTPDTTQREGVGRERHGAPRVDDSMVAHLPHLPSTYVAESVAMEWMRFLVSTGGLLGASRALRQYEDFGWISAEVRATLDSYARLAATPDDNSQHGSLSVEHHETSLSYVSRLSDRTPETGALGALAADGGIHDGLRR